MGLRERKAERTREGAVDAALSLFSERGYDSTTMEQIAERSEISTSTLYRYFATKEALLIEPLGLRGQLAGALADRPPEEPLDVALGEAIKSFVVAPRIDAERLHQIYAVISSNPGPRARLYELFVQERTALEQVVARRLERPADDLFCVMTARTTMVLIELFGERSGGISLDADGQDHQTVDLIRRLTDELRANPPSVPRL